MYCIQRHTVCLGVYSMCSLPGCRVQAEEAHRLYCQQLQHLHNAWRQTCYSSTYLDSGWAALQHRPPATLMSSTQSCLPAHACAA